MILEKKNREACENSHDMIKKQIRALSESRDLDLGSKIRLRKDL
jgi:hypothetical protein